MLKIQSINNRETVQKHNQDVMINFPFSKFQKMQFSFYSVYVIMMNLGNSDDFHRPPETLLEDLRVLLCVCVCSTVSAQQPTT